MATCASDFSSQSTWAQIQSRLTSEEATFPFLHRRSQREGTHSHPARRVRQAEDGRRALPNRTAIRFSLIARQVKSKSKLLWMSSKGWLESIMPTYESGTHWMVMHGFGPSIGIARLY